LGLLAYRRGAIGFFFWAVLPLILILIGFSLSVLNRSLLKIVLIIIIAVNIRAVSQFVLLSIQYKPSELLLFFIENINNVPYHLN
jgi:hypothetical protein